MISFHNMYNSRLQKRKVRIFASCVENTREDIGTLSASIFVISLTPTCFVEEGEVESLGEEKKSNPTSQRII